MSGILSPPYCPPLVKMPMEIEHPEYTKSFTTDQVEDYQKVQTHPFPVATSGYMRMFYYPLSSLKSMDLLSFVMFFRKLSVTLLLMKYGATLRLERSEVNQLLLVSNVMIQALGMMSGHH